MLALGHRAASHQDRVPAAVRTRPEPRPGVQPREPARQGVGLRLLRRRPTRRRPCPPPAHQGRGRRRPTRATSSPCAASGTAFSRDRRPRQRRTTSAAARHRPGPAGSVRDAAAGRAFGLRTRIMLDVQSSAPCCSSTFLAAVAYIVHPQQPAQPARTQAGIEQAYRNAQRRPERDSAPATPSANAIIDRLQQLGVGDGRDQLRRRVGLAVDQVQHPTSSRRALQARVIGDQVPATHDRPRSTASRRSSSASRSTVIGRGLLRVRRPGRRQHDAPQRRLLSLLFGGDDHHPRRRRARHARGQAGGPPTRRRRPGRQGHRRWPPRHPARDHRRPRPAGARQLRSTTWPRRCRTESSAMPGSPATSATSCGRR